MSNDLAGCTFVLRKGMIRFLIVSIVFAIGLGCSNLGSHEHRPDAVIWEAWEGIKDSHVDSAALSVDVLMDGGIKEMLNLANIPAYPLLTELDEVIDRPPKQVSKELEDLWRVKTLILQISPDVDKTALAEAALLGILNSLTDPVSRYLNPEAYQRKKEINKSSYEGIGAVIGLQDGQLTIISPMSGGPAEKAGLERGDLILKVNGRSVEGQSLEAASGHVKGAVGTRVTFLIQKPGENEPREINVTRALIEIPTIEMSLLPGSVGYLRFIEFNEGTLDETLDVLERFNQLDTLGIVIDLRNNNEGSIEHVGAVAGQFVPAGPFIYETDNDDQRRDFSIEKSGILTDGVSLVVLVNQGTGGAAEAFAAALRDMGGATLIGVRTSGSGSSNMYMELNNGSALYIPTSRWFTAGGLPLLGDGLKPDEEAALTDQDISLGRDSQLNAAYNHLDGLLPDYR